MSADLAVDLKTVFLRESFAASLVFGAGFAVFSSRFVASPLSPACAWMVVTGIPLVVSDWIEHRLPLRFVGTMLAGGVVVFAGDAVQRGEAGPLARALLSVVVVFGLGLLVVLLVPGSFGGGDVKLGAALALYLGWVGWGHVVRGFVLALLLTAVVGAVLMAAGRVSRGDRVAFGPALVGGALLALVLP